MKKSIHYTLGMLIFLGLLPFVTATINIAPLQAVYNFGDDLSLEFTITRATSAHGFLTSDLSCTEGNTEIYKTPLRSGAGEQKKILIPIKLDKFLTGNLSGRCTIAIMYGDETASSIPFEISSEVFVLAALNETLIQPGSSLKVTGSAIKKNGKPVEGLLDAAISELNITISTPIKNGLFNLIIPTSARTRAQTYVLTLYAYERDIDGILSNEGRTIVSFRVPQILTTHEIALERTSLSPPGELGYRILTYDQAEETMALESSVELYAPNGILAMSEIIRTGELKQWNIQANTTPGTWKLQATTGAMRSNKEIIINPVQNVTFALDNDTLIIWNFGNIPYTDSIQISIGGELKKVQVSLEVGGSARFKLFAPQGNHEVGVQGNNTSIDFGDVFLTGKSVDVRDADSRTWNTSPWMWWMFLILVAASIALHYYRKFRRSPSWGRSTSVDARESVMALSARTKTPVSLASTNQGKRVECTVVAAYIGNLGNLETSDSPAAQTIAKITTKAKNARAAVYTQGVHKIMIFTSDAVGNAGQAAISLARDLERIFIEHNKQYAMKIHFGIGINKGFMIVETQQGRLKFTSVGATVVVAKRLAENSKENIFISDDVSRMMIGKIKVEKVGEKAWKLKNSSGISRNAEFLKRFMAERS